MPEPREITEADIRKAVDLLRAANVTGDNIYLIRSEDGIIRPYMNGVELARP
jgi:uncharacterized protein YtpQ (UPF0354 family)